MIIELFTRWNSKQYENQSHTRIWIILKSTLLSKRSYAQEYVLHKSISTELEPNRTSLWSEVRIVLILRDRQWLEVTISGTLKVLVMLSFLNCVSDAQVCLFCQLYFSCILVIHFSIFTSIKSFFLRYRGCRSIGWVLSLCGVMSLILCMCSIICM